MAPHNYHNGLYVDMGKVYKFARDFAKENDIEIPKGSWGEIYEKDYPHYVIAYRDSNNIIVAMVRFDYRADGRIDKCNTKCNSIW